MGLFWFNKDIKKDYLHLAHVIYGGEFFLELKKYRLKEVSFTNSKIKKYEDNLLAKKGNHDFYSYKNPDSGFTANLFENIKTKQLVIAYRGTERFGLGENETDLTSVLKDVMTDINMITGTFDEQFKDAWEFYKAVKEQNPGKKIVITGQSLGGALAQIVPAKEYTINRIKVKTYTYNAPGCRHLLDTYDCNQSYDYSFITNFSVMNDWCGMFGEHIGKRLLLEPIPIKEVKSDDTTELINSVLFSTHEGIFEYIKEAIGKIIDKPKDFNQKEGLSLWYFDKNNPIKDFENIADFIRVHFPQFSLTRQNAAPEGFMQKAERFIKENVPEEVQNSGVALAIKAAVTKFTDVNDNIKDQTVEEYTNGNPFVHTFKFFDNLYSQITQENLTRAKKILKKFNLDKAYREE